VLPAAARGAQRPRIVSNPDLPSETSQHQGEVGKLARKAPGMVRGKRLLEEVVRQFRCSCVSVTDRLETFKKKFEQN
jgi:hypothetical protein